MAKHARRRRRPLRAVFSLAVALLLIAAAFWWGNRTLQITHANPVFSSLPAGFDGCRTVVLSDLHSTEFGPGNKTLLEKVRAQAPAYIFLTGDLLDQFRETPPDYVETLSDGLSSIAPTYYVTGNHEWARGGVEDLKETLRAHGVTVLSDQWTTLERNGDSLVLAGIDDPNGYADQKTPEALAAEIYAAEGDPFWILLAHRNDRFAQQYSLLGADFVISGHGHGGIIRLPLTDGLLSTDRTFFPTYTAGLYAVNGSSLFVSRGLGNSGPIPRLFNRPEVAVVTLHRG